METKRKLSLREKFAYAFGAVGKDMVYMLSANYVLYYYQDIMGVNAIFMGIILLVARVFDAFNDPVMGVIVAKTKSPFGKFRPWLLIGTVSNAIILFLMFSAPPSLNSKGLVAYAAVFYILWGITYTMMDIPFWSMVPAFTEAGKERENLSALARSCAGLGSAFTSIVTVMAVSFLGKIYNASSAIETERLGYKSFSLIIALVFIIFILITVFSIHEKSTVDVKSASVKEMFRALIKNDQALVMVFTIVLINTALYTTSNLVIYFFKYDFNPALWESNYTLFNTFGGGFQILAMMFLFPLLRRFINTIKIFYTSFFMALAGYLVLLCITFTGTTNVYFLMIPAFLIMSALGMLNVIVTVFLANTVDYGELKNGRRDESVIFSMQTFVVKLSSGIAAFFAAIVLFVCNINKESAEKTLISLDAKLGLRMSMTLIPIALLLISLFVFKSKYILTDKKILEINNELKSKNVE